jgi:MFS family permease
MPDFLNRFAQTSPSGTKEFSVVREGLVVGLLSIGTLFGAIVGRYFSDYLGRRKAIAIFCGMFSVGVLIQGEYRADDGRVLCLRPFSSGLVLSGSLHLDLLPPTTHITLPATLFRPPPPRLRSHRLHLLGPDHDGPFHLRLGRRRPVRRRTRLSGRVGS